MLLVMLLVIQSKQKTVCGETEAKHIHVDWASMLWVQNSSRRLDS
jgi:hypothetical protein